MNRFVKRRSRFFLIVSWAFAATMFADAANLDDIFSSNYVIHDDDDASAPSASIPFHDSASNPSPEKAPPSPVRLILDQDRGIRRLLARRTVHVLRGEDDFV